MSDPDDDEAVLWAPVDEDEDTTSHDGFTSEEYAACLKVIAHLAGHHGQFKLPVYKPLRENMRPLVSLESGRNFAGFNLDEYKDAKTRFANPLSLSNAFERDVAGF
eukprot:m.85497 g.85497  ORF g.85497 m.85497 type:complete len:106 (+) comp14724_c0_seq15:70-387(+)